MYQNFMKELGRTVTNKGKWRGQEGTTKEIYEPDRTKIIEERITRKTVERLTYAMAAMTTKNSTSDIHGEIFCLSTLFPNANTQYNIAPQLHQQQQNKDVSYYHKIYKEIDCDSSIEAILS